MAGNLCSPYRVCREILELGKQRITPLKLIKLAYISQGFHLGYYGKPIFDDEVEAWPYGPVIRSIYFAVNHFKRHEITKTLFEHVNDDLSLEAQRVIDAVIKTYDKYDALELSALTHRKGSPWDITVREKGINKIIPKSLIKSHYEGIIHASS